MSTSASTKLTPLLLEKIVYEYMEDTKKNNISVLSKKYNIPYPTLRRHIKSYIEAHRLEDKIREDQLPVTGFEFLQIGDTFQHSEELTIWRILEQRKVDGDLVFVVVPTKYRAKRHWIRQTLIYTEEDDV